MKFRIMNHLSRSGLGFFNKDLIFKGRIQQLSLSKMQFSSKHIQSNRQQSAANQSNFTNETTSIEACLNLNYEEIKIKKSEFTNDLLLVCEVDAKSRYISYLKLFGFALSIIAVSAYCTIKYYRSVFKRPKVIIEADAEEMPVTERMDSKSKNLLLFQLVLSAFGVVVGSVLFIYSLKVVNRVIQRLYLHKSGKHLKILFPFHTEIIEIAEFERLRPEENAHISAEEYKSLNNEGSPILIKGDIKMLPKHSYVYHKNALASIIAKKSLQITE